MKALIQPNLRHKTLLLISQAELVVKDINQALIISAPVSMNDFDILTEIDKIIGTDLNYFFSQETEFLSEQLQIAERTVKLNNERSQADALLALAKASDIFATMKRLITHDSFKDPQLAIDKIRNVLPNTSNEQIAKLLGEPASKEADRLYLIARLINRLQYSFTEKGILMWFDRPRYQLQDVSPLKYMETLNGSKTDKLLQLANY